jgi:hypothetical protein
MPEMGLSGSEGGVALTRHPYPYHWVVRCVLPLGRGSVATELGMLRARGR